jgi:hypothetical protein
MFHSSVQYLPTHIRHIHYSNETAKQSSIHTDPSPHFSWALYVSASSILLYIPFWSPSHSVHRNTGSNGHNNCQYNKHLALGGI